MKFKEKIFLVIMIILFLLSSGMFFYHNIYTTNQINKNKINALTAIRDINVGATLNSNNVDWVKIDKDALSPENIISEEDIENLKVSEKIFKGELISKNRLKKNLEEDKGFNTYIINLEPDFSPKINNGDLIRVYVQVVDKDGLIENRLVFDKKEVLEILNDDEEGKVIIKQSYDDIKIEVTDKEAVSYYNAKQMGNIIVLKYKDVVLESDYNLPSISIDHEIVFNEENNEQIEQGD